jgi:hypothetical protein
VRLGLIFSLLVAIASITANGAAAAQTFQGKLWIVTPAEASVVTLPPSAQEDVDFATNGIAYIGQGPDRNCLSIGRFLSRCSTPTVPPGVKNGLKFTGYLNPNLGYNAATASNELNNPNYGEIIEFTGTLNVTTGQTIEILHDDGVRLRLGGVIAPTCSPTVTKNCFSNGVAIPLNESWIYTGPSGSQEVDLLYGNFASQSGDGFWLVFFPQLF